jgi:hypothetical protein
MLSTVVLLLLAIGIGAIVLAGKFLAFKHDSREPPVALGAAPIVGHAIRLYKVGEADIL